MPDLTNFAVTRNGTVSLPAAPTWLISGQIVGSTNHANVLQDFTGANAVSFPQVLGSLTNAQQDELVSMVAMFLLQKRFPAAF